MKTKILLLLALSALVTLSFTFVATKRSAPKSIISPTTSSIQTNEPVGGLLSEDKL